MVNEETLIAVVPKVTIVFFVFIAIFFIYYIADYFLSLASPTSSEQATITRMIEISDDYGTTFFIYFYTAGGEEKKMAVTYAIFKSVEIGMSGILFYRRNKFEAFHPMNRTELAREWTEDRSEEMNEFFKTADDKINEYQKKIKRNRSIEIVITIIVVTTGIVGYMIYSRRDLLKNNMLSFNNNANVETQRADTANQNSLSATNATKYEVIKRYNLRKEPNDDSSDTILFTLDVGTVCYGTGAVSADGKWLEVEVNGTRGWISSQGLKLT